MPAGCPYKPSPAQYNLQPQTMYSLIKSDSKRLGSPAQIGPMGNAERLTYFKVKQENPGPGEYVPSSAFGHYVSKHAANASFRAT